MARSRVIYSFGFPASKMRTEPWRCGVDEHDEEVLVLLVAPGGSERPVKSLRRRARISRPDVGAAKSPRRFL